MDVEEVAWLGVDLLADFSGCDLGGPVEGVADGLVERDAALLVEGGDFRERVDAGVEEDLVGVGITNARDEFGVDEGVLDLSSVAFDAFEEGCLGERRVEGVGSLFVEDGNAVEIVGVDEVDLAQVPLVDVADSELVVGGVELQAEAGAGVCLPVAVGA